MTITLQDIQFRRNTASYYTSNNPLLALGEPAFETDTNKLKIGNGIDTWNSLSYITGSGGTGAVDSVNGETGVIVLTTDDLDDSTSLNKFITQAQLNKLDAIQGINTGDQDISGIATNASDINTLEVGLAATVAATVLNTAKNSYPSVDAAKVANLPSNQNSINIDIENRVSANDNKTGITSLQAGAIITNTAKVSYPGDQDASEVNLSTNINGQSTVQASLEDHESRIDSLSSGGSDGVISNVGLSGKIITFTGTGGAFDGTITLPNVELSEDTSPTLGGSLNASNWGISNVNNIGVKNYIRYSTDSTGWWDVGANPTINPTDFVDGDFTYSYESGNGTGYEGTFVIKSDGSISLNGRRIRNNANQLQFQNAAGTWVDFGESGAGGTDDQTAAEVSYDNTISGLTASNVKLALDELASTVGSGGGTTVTSGEYLGTHKEIVSGTKNGVNTTFTVSESEYNSGSLIVYLNGQGILAGDGITETTPASGIFTFDEAPESTDIIYAEYQTGVINTGENNDKFTGTAITDGYEFTSADFTTGKKLFYYEGATDIEVNVATDVAQTGEKLILWQYNSGKIQVALGSSINGKEFSTVDNSNPVTLTKQFSTFGYQPIGNSEDYTSIPLVTSIYPHNNPLAIGANESSTIWTSGSTNFSIALVSTGGVAEPINGDYAVLIEKIGANNTFSAVDIPMGGTIAGRQYKVEIYTKEIIGTGWGIQLSTSKGWTSSDSYVEEVVGDYIKMTLTGTASDTTGQPRAYSDGPIGDQFVIDYIIVTDITP